MKPLFLFLAASLFCPVCGADDMSWVRPPDTGMPGIGIPQSAPAVNSDLSWMKKARIPQKDKSPISMDWAKPKELSGKSAAAAEEIVANSRAVLERVHASAQPQTAKTATQGKKDGSSAVILVSLSMPAKNLSEAIEEAVDTNSVLAFRGVPKNSSIPKLITAVKRLLKGKNRIPSVVINPVLFTELRASQVPLVAYPVPGSNRYATMRGLVNITYMKRRVGDGSSLTSFDLGRQGATWPVAEPDMVEEMKRRIMAIDWEKKKEAAINRFWTNQHYQDLPEAKQTVSWTFDPTLVLNKDVTLPDGRVLIKAGTAINPLARIPLTKRYIIFDARKKWQVELAKRLYDKSLSEGRGAMLIMTDFDTAKGWDGFESLSKHLGARIMLLDEVVKSRFHLRAVPSVAESEGTRMKISEFSQSSN